MKWFEQTRQLWIAEMLTVYGFIQRKHLMRKFDISVVQASKDLRSFDRMYPGWMEYNRWKKHYVYLGKKL